MVDENRNLIETGSNDRKRKVSNEVKRFVGGALDATREPLHEVGDKLVDYCLNWAIKKVRGSAE